MIASFITYHDGTEPFVSMAERLANSVIEAKAGVPHILVLKPNGGSRYAEALGQGYQTMTDFIDEGPVILIDADCIVNKPIYDLFKTDFVVAAVHRGHVSTSMGDQDFLGSVVMFHPAHPNAARYVWLWWAEKTLKYAREAPPVAAAEGRNNAAEKAGWLPDWYCDQTALNDILRRISPEDVMRLKRDEYAAHPNKEDAYITHFKGSGKLR